MANDTDEVATYLEAVQLLKAAADRGSVLAQREFEKIKQCHLRSLEPEPSCSVEGCEADAHAKGMCTSHYGRWYRDQTPHLREAYNAKRRRGISNAERKARAEAKLTSTKTCEECGDVFSRQPGRADRQWESARFCSRTCVSTANGRRQKPKPWATTCYARQAADQWENQRRVEDREDLRRPVDSGPACPLSHRPEPRHFLGWFCRSCGDPFIYYTKRAQSPFCADCNHNHHRGSANRRARKLGVVYENIDPARVFERDGHRCQICGIHTRGQFPALTAPTIDHIVPLSRGGPHTYANVQCACFRCNSIVKRDGATNDQLRLVA